MKHRVRGVLAAAAVIGGLLVSITSGVPAVSATSEVPALVWGTCPAGIDSRLECTTVPVPLDYSDPNSELIDIAISRLASTNPAQRRGVMFLLPGGPGDPGLNRPGPMATRAPAELDARYDYIGIDPRGVANSAPVSCGFTPAQNVTTHVPPYALTPADVDAHATYVEALADQCGASADYERMRHMTTINIVRDVDRIRIALGEEKISIYGFSHGTALGAAYAAKFPAQSDRVVLDSSVGDTYLGRDGWRRFGRGMEDRFPEFAEWAAARHSTYGLGSTPAQVRSNYFTLAGQLDAQPVGTVNGKAFRRSVFSNLYHDAYFPTLAQYWENLAAQVSPSAAADLSELAAVQGSQQAVTQAVPWPTIPADNYASIQLAILCGDSSWPRNVATYKSDVAADRIAFPLFGAAAANITPCAFWPDDPIEPPVLVTTTGLSNILIVQNLRDVPTPHVAAADLRQRFGNRARLVSADQGGHGAYLYLSNTCLNNATTDFFVDGTFPATDVVCPANGAGPDTTAPATQVSLTPDRPDGDPVGDFADTYRTPVTVSATAGDGDGFGIRSVEYSVDGGAWTEHGAAVVVGEWGKHTVAVRATDHASNVSAEESVSFELREDACPGSDLSATVVLGGVESRVANYHSDTGCSVNDLLAPAHEIDGKAAAVRYVRDTTAKLVSDGVVTAREAGLIVRAAASSDLGR